MRLAERPLPESGNAAAVWGRAVLRPEQSVRGILAVGLFWACAGLAAGTGTWAASRLDGGSVGWVGALTAPMLAALWWVPITVAASWLARRFRLGRPLAPGEDRGDGPAAAGDSVDRGSVWTPWLVHAAAAVAVSFALNLGWTGTLAALGRLEPGMIPDRTVTGAVRWLHVNAAVYLAIVGMTTLLHRVMRGDGSGAAGGPARLRVGSGGRSRLVDVDRIDWIEGAGDYACIHAAGREHLSSRRLKELERLLDPRFVRIHRSSIVNVDRIRELRHVSHGDCEAELACGTVLRVSRRRRAGLTEVLEARTLGETQPG